MRIACGSKWNCNAPVDLINHRRRGGSRLCKIKLKIYRRSTECCTHRACTVLKGSCSKDLIICRNVLIYFDKATQKELVSRYAELLAPNGCLMLGHSENLSAEKDLFNAIGRTTYRKNG